MLQKACASPRNLTWFTRPFLLERVGSGDETTLLQRSYVGVPTFTYNFQILVTVFGAAFTVFRELHLCLSELCLCILELRLRCSSGNVFQSAVLFLKTCTIVKHR